MHFSIHKGWNGVFSAIFDERTFGTLVHAMLLQRNGCVVSLSVPMNHASAVRAENDIIATLSLLFGSNYPTRRGVSPSSAPSVFCSVYAKLRLWHGTQTLFFSLPLSLNGHALMVME